MSFRILGCRVNVSFYFFVLLCICAMADNKGIMLSGLAAALCHEAGHLASALMLKLRINAIEINSAGFRMYIPSLEHSRKNCITVALAGAFVNSVLFLCFLPIAENFAAANLALCIISLLPCEPLDGGLVLRTALEGVISEKSTDVILFIFTLIFLMALLCAGTLILLKSVYNYSLLTLSLLLFTTICQRALK